MADIGCDHEFRIAQLLYEEFGGGTQLLTDPSAALVVCRKCGTTRRSAVGRTSF